MVRPPAELEEPTGPDLRRLLALIRPHARSLALASVIVVGISGVSLVAPRLAGHVLDTALIRRDENRLDVILIALAALFAIRGLLRFAQIYLVRAAGSRMVADLRARLLDHLMLLSPSFFAKRHSGELISRITSDIAKMQSALIDRVPDGVQAVVTFVGTISMLVVIRADLALLTLVVVPPVVVLALFYGRSLTRLSVRTGDAAAGATQVASEALSGITTVQAFGQEDVESTRHRHKLDALVGVELTYARVLGSFSGLMQFLGFGAFAVVLWYGGTLVARNQMSPGDLTAFLLYTFGVAGSIGTLGSLYSTMKSLKGASARVFEIVDTPPDIESPAGASALARFRGHIELSEVEFHYPERETHPALRRLSLEIQPNEMVALVGPSGGGKSTIFSLLLRFYDPKSGQVSLDGRDLRELDLGALRRAIGLVPQDIYLFSGTVAENIRYGAPDAELDAVVRAAELAGAKDFIEELPRGFDEVVGERGVRLSAGQRQRIAIARAFLRESRVLLLDEATSALDPDSEATVQAALSKLTEGRTTIVIAHRLATAKRADRIIVLADGRIIDSGTHESLQETSEVYRRYWKLQSLAGLDSVAS